MSAAHESANFDYRFPAAEQSDWCTFRVSNGAMGTVAFTPSLKVRRHWDSAQTLAANPTKPASTREVIHLVFLFLAGNNGFIQVKLIRLGSPHWQPRMESAAKAVFFESRM